jgi:hypothetical protein
MQVRLSKDATVDALAARVAAHRTIAIGQGAGYQRLALAIDGQRRQRATQSDRTQSIIVSHQRAA